MAPKYPDYVWGNFDDELVHNYSEDKIRALLFEIFRTSQFIIIATVSLFLAVSLVDLIAIHTKPIRIPMFTRHLLTYLTLQIITATIISYETFLFFSNKLTWPIEREILNSTACVASLAGCFVSIASILLSRPQTPRLLYTLCALVCNTSVALITSQWWPIGLMAVLCFLLLWSDLSIPPCLRLADKSAIEESPLFGKLNFAWLAPLFSVHHPLSWEDAHMLSIPADILQNDLSQKLESARVGERMQLPSFNVFLWKICPKEIVMSFFFEVADIVIKFALPWILKLFLENQQPYLIVLMFAANIINSIVKSQASYNVKVAGAKLRTGIANAIFEKTLRLSLQHKSLISVPNLIEVDIQRLLDFVIYTHAIWSAPLQVILCLSSIAFILGWESAAAGIIAIMIMMPFFSFCSVQMAYWQGLTMASRDVRLSMTSEILYRIKNVKIYGKQALWSRKLDECRSEELKTLGPIAWLTAAMNVLMRSTPMLISIAAFGALVLRSKSLTSNNAFPALLMFGLLVQPLSLIPTVTSAWTNCMVSYSRLREFFHAPELHKGSPRESPVMDMHETSVSMKSVTFRWPGTASSFISNTSISFPAGKLIAITGPLGSGKSTLLQLMMGLLEPKNGEVKTSGKFAYVPQNAWLLSGTMRENIILENSFNQKLYDKAVMACALDVDFKTLPNGDFTVVGSLGAACSGGQKARISLARAVYSQAQIIFLDDPLAAVDAKVKNHLISEVLGPNGIWKDSLRIVTGNSSEVSRIADELYDLSGGVLKKAISGSSPDDNLIDLELLATPVCMNQTSTIGSTVVLNFPSDPEALTEDTFKIMITKTTSATTTLAEVDLETADLKSLIPATNNQTSSRGVVHELYWRWLNLAGIWSWFLVLVGIALANGSNVASVYVLKLMTDPDSLQTPLYIGLYCICGLLQGLLICGWLMVAWYLCSLPTSYKAHSQLSIGIFRSPMYFFDATPIGHILNHFTNDLSRMDSALYGAWLGVMNSAVRILAAVLVLIYSSPVSLCYILPLLFACWVLQRQYIRICLQLKHLETNSRSPLLNNLQEIQSGAATIRIYGCDKIFRQKNVVAIKQNIEAYFCLFCLELWLTMRLEFFSSVIQLLAATTLVYQKVDPGTLGLIMSYLLQVSSYLTSTVLLQTQVESEMVSVQRIFKLSDMKPESTGFDVTHSLRSLSKWPSHGKVSFKNYSASYKPDFPSSLLDITIEIREREKVAVVGRTGAGKSSFALAILRILEKTQGKIEIDDIDISKVDLEFLRSKIAVIPQDCQAFSGTVRDNLDPEGLYDDARLIRVIEDSCFSHGFADSSEALHWILVDGGSNISNGQKQLLILAQAMLVESKILILDEATASVDPETEKLVHQTISKHFHDKTIITIAHRLETILESDRVIVLDQGTIVEMGSPEELTTSGGYFAELLEGAGL